MNITNTSWIARSATARAVPAPRLPAPREAVLAAVLDPGRMPTQPAIAVQVVEAASNPDCRPGDIVNLLSQDPILCAQLLKAVNSGRYGFTRPVGTIERAVVVAGLNNVRSLALGLSLPAMKPQSRMDPAARAYALASVSGATIARELSARLGHEDPNDALVAGLLRDLGVLLLQQTFPKAWADLVAKPGHPLGYDECERERAVFGVDHAEVGAEALASWSVPAELVAVVRHHHQPDLLAGTPGAERAELLWFADQLTRLESLVEHPTELDRVLAIAKERFGMSLSDLAEFLDNVVPKIDRFAALINLDIGHCPNFPNVLSIRAEEMAKLIGTPA
jgi:HD-like signal output (HDOD) protein